MGSTYQSPIANDYLEARAELGTALFALSALAQEAHAAPETLQTLQNLQAGLREPFLFVVVGEVKAGKSSLLNALFGKEFCRVDVLPATDRVHVFKFGEQARDVPLHPDLVERYQPVGFLRDFNIVDTPGTNTVVTQHQRITEQFAPLADLILFVFSVVNPWGASAWQFLEHLQQKWRKNVVFVVQQSDLREEREVQAIVQHLKQTAAARCGQAFPVFAVSAKKAFLSKTSGVDKARLWTESRFGPLEDYINEVVGTGETRREKLRSIDRTAQVILADLTSGARDIRQTAAADRAELERLRGVVAQQLGRTDLQVEGFLRGVDTAFSRCQHQGEHLLRQKLRRRSSLGLAAGRDARWPVDFQRNFESMLHAAVSRQMAHALDLLAGELGGVWSQLRAGMEANFSAGARERLGEGEVAFADGRAGLTEKIETAVVEHLTDDRLEKQFRAAFAGMARAMRGRFVLALVIALAAGGAVVARLAPWWVALAGAVAAVGIFASGSAAVADRRRAVFEDYRAQMRVRQEALSEAVGGLIRQAIEAFYLRAAGVYEPVAAFCQTQQERHRPVLERVDNLEKMFAKVAARL